ncbi:MAG: hypothetical protein ACREHE_12250 [Rhizomicrobium sp.]
MDPAGEGAGKPSASTDSTQTTPQQNAAPQSAPPNYGAGASPYPSQTLFPPQEFLRALSLGQVSGDMAILTMTVAALTPVLQSLFALSAASSQRLYQANQESSQTSLAALAAMSLAAHKLLNGGAPAPAAQPSPGGGNGFGNSGGGFSNTTYQSGTGPQSLAVT